LEGNKLLDITQHSSEKNAFNESGRGFVRKARTQMVKVCYKRQ